MLDDHDPNQRIVPVREYVYVIDCWNINIFINKTKHKTNVKFIENFSHRSVLKCKSINDPFGYLKCVSNFYSNSVHMLTFEFLSPIMLDLQKGSMWP